MKLVGSRGAVRTPQFHREKERAKIYRYIGFTVALAVLIVAPVLALRSPNLQITNVEVSGNNIVKAEEVRQIILDNLKGFYLWFIPKSSLIFYPNSLIQKKITSAYPRLLTADVSLANLHTIATAVIEREPYALYCSSSCFFMDSTGFIFAEAPDFSDDVYLIYKSEPEDYDPLGTQFVSSEEFSKLDKFASALERFSMEPKYLIKKVDEYAVVIRGGAEVRWRADQNLDTLESDLGSFLQTSRLNPTAVSNLSYIDLRFENKVFYK